MPTGSLAGRDAFWRSFGDGPRQALMIHCSLAHSGAWRGLARHLGDALSMTAFDMPGHGRSGAWNGVGEYQKVSADMAADLVPSDAQIDLIGHSFGATVALRFAVAHPERVRSLSLIEPVFFAVAFQDDPSCRAAYDRDVAGFEAAWGAGDHEGAARAFTAMWGDGTPWEALPAQQRDMLVRLIHLIPAGGPALHDDVGGILHAGRLDALKAPALMIEGSESHWSIARIARGLARRLNAERQIVQGAGHMLPITHTAEVAGLLRKHLALP